MKKKIMILLLLFAILAYSSYVQAQLSVHIHGVEGSLKHRLYNDLSIDGAYYQQQEMTSNQAQNLALRGEREILQTLQSFGYYAPTLHLTVEEKKPQRWVIDYSIVLNNPVKIHELSFSIRGGGENDSALLETLKPFLPTLGQKFDHTTYETHKTQLLAATIESGYLDAHLVDHEVRIDTSALSADITLTLNTGPLYTFGNVSFSKSLFDDTFLSRYAAFKPGEAFSSEQMLQFQGALRSTKYFSSIQVFPERENDSLAIPLTVSMELKEPNNYLAGIGYTTDTGMRGRLGWERRYLNRFGHSFLTSANIAEKRQQYNAKYQIPGRHPANDQYQVALQETREEIDHRLSNTRTASISSLARIGEWQRLVKLEYMIASYRELQGLSTVNDHFILPSINFVKRVTDDPIYPERGYRLDVTLRGAVDIILSSETFAQFHTNFKAITPVFDGPTHLLLGGEFGTTAPNTNNLPLMLRFYAGGDRSVRGYRYLSLGPKGLDAKGRAVNLGGKHLMVATAEIDHPISQMFRAAVFFDIGGAVNRFSDRLSSSVGTGIRWRSPVGPIRLDIAHPLDEQHSRQDWRFHLSIGPDL